MKTFSSLEIGLSFVCGCVILGCVAEVYYLLWWKKRRININIDIENQKSSFSSFSFSSFSSNYTPTHFSCWKGSKESKPTKTQENYQESEMGMVQDHVLNDLEEESLDLELMRLHNLHGPPRFLTTIDEETKEEMESEKSRKGSRTRSLSDLLVHFDTPQASPPIKGSQMLDMESFEFNNEFNQHGLNINPLFEVDGKGLRCSPPPTFKFLRDAEEKLLRRLKELEGGKMEESDGSFVNMCGSKGKYVGSQVSAVSKVLPLASSPSKQ